MDPVAQAVWLDGEVRRREARSINAGAAFQTSIAKRDRAALSVIERSKLMMRAETGLEYKFRRMEYVFSKDGQNVPTKESLKGVYEVGIRIEEFEKSLKSFDMSDVFIIPSIYEEADDENGIAFWQPSAGARPVNLFTSHTDVDLDTVKQASEYFFRFGPDWMVQNLIWSGNKLLNSCEEDLRLDIEATVKDYPEYLRTGPVYLKLITKEILVTDESAIDALKILFGKQKVSDFDGEDVSEYVAVVRVIKNLLRNCPGRLSQVPTDAVNQIARGLKTTSTEEFNEMISTVLTNHRTGVKTITIEDLLTLAKDNYITMRTNGQWVKGTEKGKQDSVFFAGKCYDCGNTGHRAKDCPQKQSGGNTNANSHGSNPQAGRGRGFGRGYGQGRGNRGRGRGRGQPNAGRGNGGGTNTDSNQLDRHPPKRGEPKSRNQNGRVEHWCGKCGYWSNHTTDNHQDIKLATDSHSSDKQGSSDKKDDNTTNKKENESGRVVFTGGLVPRF